jgi:hypothetical protein
MIAFVFEIVLFSSKKELSYEDSNLNRLYSVQVNIL